MLEPEQKYRIEKISWQCWIWCKMVKNGCSSLILFSIFILAALSFEPGMVGWEVQVGTNCKSIQWRRLYSTLLTRFTYGLLFPHAKFEYSPFWGSETSCNYLLRVPLSLQHWELQPRLKPPFLYLTHLAKYIRSQLRELLDYVLLTAGHWKCNSIFECHPMHLYDNPLTFLISG